MAESNAHLLACPHIAHNPPRIALPCPLPPPAASRVGPIALAPMQGCHLLPPHWRKLCNGNTMSLHRHCTPFWIVLPEIQFQSWLRPNNSEKTSVFSNPRFKCCTAIASTAAPKLHQIMYAQYQTRQNLA